MDRLSLKKIERRLSDSLETTAKLSNGLVIINTPDDGKTDSTPKTMPADCGINMEELSPLSSTVLKALVPYVPVWDHSLEQTPLIIPNDSLSLRGRCGCSGWNNWPTR